jgi:hypothetical protein
MTKTTAKKGMIECKTGHSKNDFDYDYLQSINYDDKRKLKEVIETLFSVNTSLAKEIDDMKLDRDKFIESYNELKEEHDRMLKNVKALSTFTLD